jgi:LysR family glycine cleavage system transcriptional activator
MRSKLPSLNGLKVFEAVARHLSFTKAADELHVTQAAASHQIRKLELQIGVQLFIRQSRKIQLTNEGKSLLPVMTKSLDAIADRLLQVSADDGFAMLKVKLAPSISAKWLSPRLNNFWRHNPDINLSLFHSNDEVDFVSEEIDVAITYGDGKWPNVESFHLLSLDFFPVCSPALVVGFEHELGETDLAKLSLLHDANYQSWSSWVRSANFSKSNPNRGTIIDDTNVLVQAAIDGQGVAMGSSLLVSEHLRSGRLVRLFDHVLKPEEGYYVICPKTHLERQNVRLFKSWLLSQI